MNISLKLIVLIITLMSVNAKVHSQYFEGMQPAQMQFDSIVNDSILKKLDELGFIYQKYLDSLRINYNIIPVTVNVHFVLNKNGEAKDVKATSIVCDECDDITKRKFIKKAEKSIKASIKWNPMLDTEGNPKETNFEIPVRYMMKANNE